MHGSINIDNDMLPMRHMDVYEYRSNEAPSEGRTGKGGEGGRDHVAVAVHRGGG